MPDGNVIPFPSRWPPELEQPVVPPAPEEVRRYVVRVDLEDTEPPIWRRLELTSDQRLSDLHDLLQTAMGWTDSHLHQFVAGPRETTAPFVTDFAESEGDEGPHERAVRLDQVLREPGDRLLYEYDFGDGWQHTIVLERVEPHDPAGPRTRVVDGERACPPEDCGGTPGYAELLALRADRESADDWGRERLAWLGEDFDPDAFSAAEADALLQRATRAHSLLADIRAGRTPVKPAVRELIERDGGGPSVLAQLVAEAEPDRADEPDRAMQEALMRPFLHLMDVVGSGVPLTSAGWLPPAVVSRLCADLDLLEPWMGKGNREQNTPPVRVLRQSAVATRKLRKVRNQLVPTTKGIRAASSAAAMWAHLTGALPLGRKDHERHAGAVMLLGVAAGLSPYQAMKLHAPAVLWGYGWAVDGRPPDEWDALEWARPTWDLLRALEGDQMSLRKDADPELRLFARAALLA